MAIKVVRHGQVNVRGSRWIWQLFVASKSWWWWWGTCEGDMVVTAVTPLPLALGVVQGCCEEVAEGWLCMARLRGWGGEHQLLFKYCLSRKPWQLSAKNVFFPENHYSGRLALRRPSKILNSPLECGLA